MFEEIRGIVMSQKIEIRKETYYELKPKPTSSDTIAVYPYLVKLKIEKNKHYAYAYSYWVKVKRRCICLESSQCQIVLEYYNGHDKSEQFFPCSILQSKEISALLSYGVVYEERFVSSLITYLLQSMQNVPTEYLYQRLGWEQRKEELLFKGYEVISKEDKYCNYSYNGDLDIAPKGSLKVWLDMVKSEVIGNVPLTFVLALGFASPILALLNEKYDLGCIIFNLSNYSSRGKSTAAALSASISSNPKLNKGTLKSFYATENALAEFVSNCNGITVALDEIAMSASPNFERFLFALCSGTSKQRLNGDSTLKEVKKFSSVIISTAEFDILNENSPDGLKARVFELTDDLTTSSRNSDAIKTVVLENYAVAGDKFIEKLIDYGKDNLFELYDYAVEQLKKAKVKVWNFLADTTKENIEDEAKVNEKEIAEKLTKLKEYMENPDNFNEVRYVLSQYIQRVDVSNDGVAVKFKAPVSSKNDSIMLSETIHTSRKDLNKDYQFVENNIELSSKLDKLYNLSKME